MKLILATFFMFTGTAFAHQTAPATNTLVFADGALKVDLTWAQGPRSPEVSEMKMEWKSGVDQTRVEPPGPVKVTLWMPMHGHGSSPVTLTKDGTEPGVYKVTNMYFSMTGDWEVRVNLKYTNGREETKTSLVPIKGAGGAPHHH